MAQSTAEPFVLVVEDDPGQTALIQAAFKKNLPQARLHFVLSGWEAQTYLARESPYHDWDRCPPPSLIVLDLGLPDISGLEILEWMAEWKWLARIPVIVFTGSQDPEDARKAHELGVRRYMMKLDDVGELVTAAREELGLPAVENTPRAVSSGQEREVGTARDEPKSAKRLTGLPLLSASVLAMTAIVLAYEAMRYVSTSGVLPVPLYVMAASYIAISALVAVYFVNGLRWHRTAVEVENERLDATLHRSRAEVATLSGLLSICAHCKRVKDSEGNWHPIDTYIGGRSEAVFRNGLCEACVHAVLPEDAEKAG